MHFDIARTGQRVDALEGIDLSVEPGTFVSIVGPSGCGKTTLLKIVNGLVTPSSGRVIFDDGGEIAAGRQRAMVFQDASLFPWFTVQRNVAYGLECQGVPLKEARERALPVIELVGLRGFERHYPHELSGGMQQRVNLARALAVQPRVLLMDEPFASLDAQTRESMQAELLRIWQQSTVTVLFITHQIDEAVYLSDRVLVLSARPGRLVADETIGLPRPRELAIKHDQRFQRHVQQIWELIQTHSSAVVKTSEEAPSHDR